MGLRGKTEHAESALCCKSARGTFAVLDVRRAFLTLDWRRSQAARSAMLKHGSKASVAQAVRILH